MGTFGNPGAAYVQGASQGQADNLKQEANNRANQMQAQQTQMNNQNISMNDMKMKDMQNKLDAQKRIDAHRDKATKDNLVNKWNPDNAEDSVQQLNGIGYMAGKEPMKLANYEQTKKYLSDSGYEKSYYDIIKGEDGKEEVKYYSSEEFMRLGKTDEENALKQRISANSEKDFMDHINSAMPYVLSSGDDKSVINIGDLVKGTGGTLSPEFLAMDQKLTGSYVSSEANKMPTYPKMISDWQKENPNATNDELKEFTRSLLGKSDSDSGSGSGYSWQAKTEALSKIYGKLSRGEKLDSSEQALFDVLGGTSVVASVNKSEATSKSMTMGETIIDSKNDAGTYEIKNQEASKKNQAKAEARDKKLTAAIVEYSTKTQAVQGIMDMQDTLKDAVDAGIRVDVIGESLASLQKMTPDEISSLYDSDTLSTKLQIKGQEAMIVGQIVKALYGSKASNMDRESVEGAYSKKFFDNTATAEMKVKNLLDYVHTAYTRTGEALVKRGGTYTPVNEMNSITTRMDNRDKVTYKTVTQGGKTYKAKYINGKYASAEEL